jgi:hypothetical protein
MRFLLVARVGRGREGVVRDWGVFVGCKSGERKRALGEKGGFCWFPDWDICGRGTYLAIIENCSRKD